MKIHNPHPERTKLAFPSGFPQEFTLEDINPRLERVGLIAKSKFPGLVYSIEVLNQQPNRCYSGKCREPLCRSLHGETEQKITWWANMAGKETKDDLFMTTDRLSRHFRLSGAIVQNISLQLPINLDFYLYTRDFKVHRKPLIDVDDLFSAPLFQVDTPNANGDVFSSSVAEQMIAHYTLGRVSRTDLAASLGITLDTIGEDE